MKIVKSSYLKLKIVAQRLYYV